MPSRKKDFKHELGWKVKDIITGFEGIVTGRAEHITGCNSYWVKPQKLTAEGKPLEAEYFDEDRLEFVDEGINPKKVQGKKPGGAFLMSKSIGG